MSSERIRRARAQLLLDHPFFGALACCLEPRERHDLQTLGADFQHLYFNPAWARQVSDQDLVFAVAHVVQHLVLQHFCRRGRREEPWWDIAADLAVNGLLQRYGFRLPAAALYDPEFDGKTAEEIYSIIVRRPPKYRTSDTLDHHLNTSMSGQARALTDEWTRRVARVATMLKQQGKLPGSLEALVRDLLESRVDWRRILYRFIVQNARSDYSYARCNRRYMPHNLYLPGLQSERIENIVIALDTSGSIEPRDLQQFLGEVNAVAAQFQVRWTLVTCDAQVQDVFECDNYTFDPRDVRIRGRGGTDFRPVFQWLSDRSRTPACLIYLTDGQGDFPGEAPAYPVLWVLTRPCRVPFGEQVVLEE